MTENTDSHPDKDAQLEDSAGEPAHGQDAELSGQELPDQDTEADDEVPSETLIEAQARAEEHWNKYLRVTAEMDNIRKRTTRDLENARKYGVERFARELLAVLDSLEMGLETDPNVSTETMLEGKKATLKLLMSAMKKFEIEELDPEGEVFDPQLHEAISTLPSDTVEPGSVVTVVQKGYRIYDRLLRPARVVVAADQE